VQSSSLLQASAQPTSLQLWLAAIAKQKAAMKMNSENK